MAKQTCYLKNSFSPETVSKYTCWEVFSEFLEPISHEEINRIR
jgi:hypothetical protein